jgi:hypothetical protein
MEKTEGLGREAEVWVDGHLLVVCDGISPPGSRCPPGPIDAKFSYMTAAGFSWESACGGNPSKRRTLEHERGWRYVGYGRVEQIMPVVVDFGVLVMEDANWTTDERLVGRFVRIGIDRLEVVPSHEADWPADEAESRG